MTNEIIIAGKLIVLGEAEKVGKDKSFLKRLVVVQTDEQYPQQIPIEFLAAKTTLLDKYKLGDDVKIAVNIRGRESNGKYYLSFSGWKIEADGFSVMPSAMNDPFPTIPLSEVSRPSGNDVNL